MLRPPLRRVYFKTLLCGHFKAFMKATYHLPNVCYSPLEQFSDLCSRVNKQEHTTSLFLPPTPVQLPFSRARSNFSQTEVILLGTRSAGGRQSCLHSRVRMRDF